MAQVVCISNQKGGVGKTSLTLNTANILATEHNKKVLLVDIDGQSNLTTSLGFDPDEVKTSITDLLLEKSININSCILGTSIKNIFLIPSTKETFSTEKRLYERAGREFYLSDRLEKVRTQYDYIFIDTPPNLGILTLNSLISSNAVVLVYTASEFALDGVSQIMETVEEIQSNSRFNLNKTRVIGAIQNRYRPQNKTVNNKLREELEGVSIGKMFQHISDTTEIEKSQFEHKPISLYNPKHQSSDQFRIFAKELISCLD